MMSLVVNTDGDICIASDADHPRVPVLVHLNVETRNVGLVFEDGSEITIGRAGQTEMYRHLRAANHVQYMQIRPMERPERLRLPLHVQIEEARNQAAI